MSSSRRLLTAEFRMSFPKLVVPEAFKGKGAKDKGDPSYSSECLIKADHLTKFLEEQDGNLVEVDVRRVLVAVAQAEWGADFSVKEAVEKGEITWPIKDGDEYAAEVVKKALAAKKDPKNVDHYKGLKVFRVGANQEYAPVLTYVDGKVVKTINRASDTDMAKAKNLFTGGNYAIAEVSAAAVETPQGRFLKFYVNSVRCVRTGERIGGGPGLMGKFDGTTGGKTTSDPMKGLDDEIPF